MKKIILLCVVLICTKLYAQNIGIGTTTPLAKLHILSADTGMLRIENSTTLAAGVSNAVYFKTANWFTGAIKNTGTASSSSRMGFFGFASTATSGLKEYMSITDAGDVGIGTINPQAKLNVQTTGYGFLQSDATGQVQIGTDATSAGGWLGTRSKDNLYLFTNNQSPVVTVDTFYNVGIGTTTPDTKLTVQATGAGIEHTNGTIKIATYIGGTLAQVGTVTNQPFQLMSNNGAGQFVLNTNSSVGIGNSNPTLAGLVVDTKVGAANAIFGGNTTGISIESNYPGIGFNSYYSSGRKYMNTGYGGVISLNPTNGLFSISLSTASGTASNGFIPPDVFTLDNDGGLQLQGANAGYLFRDRSITSYGGWNWYADGGTAKLYRYTSGGDLLAIDATGKLGVGTTTPTGKLDVNGNTLTKGLTSTVSGGTFGISGNSQNGSAIYGVASGTGVGGQFASASGPALITTLGNTGLGTSTPNSTLQVNGSFSLPIKTVSTGYTATDQDYTLYISGSATSGDYTVYIPAASASLKGRIYKIITDNPYTGVNNIFVSDQTANGFLYQLGPSPEGGPTLEWDCGVTIQCTGTKWIITDQAVNIHH